MVKCSVPSCNNTTYKKTPEITFHRFPKDDDMKLLWLKNMKRQDWQPTPSSVLCSEHFEAHLKDESGFRTVLAARAIPTIFDVLQGDTPILSRDPLEIVQENVSVFSAPIPYLQDENIQRNEEQIRKMVRKDMLKSKQIKILKQQNRRLKNRLSKLSEIISRLKGK